MLRHTAGEDFLAGNVTQAATSNLCKPAAVSLFAGGFGHLFIDVNFGNRTHIIQADESAHPVRATERYTQTHLGTLPAVVIRSITGKPMRGSTKATPG